MRLTLLAALVLAAPLAAAQDADPADAVRATITDLFDGMRAKDTTAIRATLHPVARLMTAASRDGDRALVESPIGAFLESVAGAPVELDERIPDTYPVMVDDGLAMAWTPYEFWAGGQRSHCGTNAFLLTLTNEGWRIVQIIDTRQRACGEE